MSNAHDHELDETLLSGYLDGELTQGEAQRVRLHLEDCAQCRDVAAEVGRIREATMTTNLPLPDDRQWDETPRGGFSALLRNFGWTMMIVWVAGLASWGIYHLVTDTENLLVNLLVFGFWLGVGLVFLSVALDRLKTYKTDRYRRVEK